MYYQPKVRLSDGRVAGAEALIRWEHPTLGLVRPDGVHPAAREDGAAAAAHLLRDRGWCSGLARVGGHGHPPAGRGEHLASVAPRPATLPERVEELLARLRGAAGVPAARAHRELPDGATRAAPTARARSRCPGVGVGSVDRRLRHRILLALVPEAAADRGDQDRPLVRDAHARRRERLDDRARHGRARPEPRAARRRRGRRGPRHLRSARRVRVRRGPGLLHRQAARARGVLDRWLSVRESGSRRRTARAGGARPARRAAPPPSRISPGGPLAGRGGAVRVVVPGIAGGGGMSLRDVLDALVGSAPFERLLLARARPIVARASSAERPPSCAASRWRWTRRARGRPRPPRSRGPRPRDRCLPRPERVALLPAWDALPYEGIGPAPRSRRGGPTRSGASRSADGPFVLVAPDLAAMQGSPPTLGTAPLVVWPRASCWRPTRSRSASSSSGTRGPTSSSTAASSPSEAASSTSSPGSPGGPRASSTGAMRSSRSASSRPRRSCPRQRPARRVAPVRELVPDDDVSAARRRARRRRARPLPRRPAAPDGRRAAPRGDATRSAPFLFDHLPDPGRAAARRRVGGRDRRASARSGAPAQAHADAEALADAIGWPGADGASRRPGRGARRPRAAST